MDYTTGFQIEGKYADADVFASEVEGSCVSQIHRMANHPAFDLRHTGKHIAIMPDSHPGKGSVIGFTMPLQGRIVPSVVGVDIGCGVSALEFAASDPLNLSEIDKKIRDIIPMGFKVREGSEYHLGGKNKWDPFDSIRKESRQAWNGFIQGGHPNDVSVPPAYDYEWYGHLCVRIGMDFGRAQASIGSLGGGNHFIEIGIGEVDGGDIGNGLFDAERYWLFVHSGSRQLGEKVCRYWQRIANLRQQEKLGEEYEAAVRHIRDDTVDKSKIPERIRKMRLERGVVSGPKELDFLEGEDFYGYIWDMFFAQWYASRNRRVMRQGCFEAMGSNFRTLVDVDTVHNYVDCGDLMVRKGAVSAHKNEFFVLPFNMRDGTLICAGKGNEDWNQSAPHGAGRLFSRSEAKRTLDAHEAAIQMEGIYTSNIPLDEAPGAYKSCEVIEKAVGPTANVIGRVRPILNIKAG